ncbi:mitochondrial Homoaconitase [Sporothrix curviconia]|uniref:Mitochondrial Homoaconitase n=1 Tax=Sporothrix curviconia TaxID=1260050 RepID=A0ABP0B6U3_9PEZI
MPESCLGWWLSRQDARVRQAAANDGFPSVVPSTPQTLTKKLVQRCSIGLPAGKKVKSGDYITLQPHHCMTHDSSWPVSLKVMSIGTSEIHDNRQVVCTIDHDVQNKTKSNLK